MRSAESDQRGQMFCGDEVKVCWEEYIGVYKCVRSLSVKERVGPQTS